MDAISVPSARQSEYTRKKYKSGVHASNLNIWEVSGVGEDGGGVQEYFKFKSRLAIFARPCLQKPKININK